MPFHLPILAACVMIVAPGFFAGNISLILLLLWVDRLLRTDPSVYERLRIDLSDGTFGWKVAAGDTSRRRPFVPLIGTALAAVLLTVAETALFAAVSDVPHFWYLSGSIASVVIAALPLIAAALLGNALDRRINLMLAHRANDRFAFAFQTLFVVYRIDEHLDELYSALALVRRTRALASCRQVLVEHADARRDVVLAALEAAKSAAEHDLRELTSLATEIRAATALLERTMSAPDEADALKQEAERVAQVIQSRTLADALETGRWSDASLLFENIRLDLDKLSAMVGADPAMPRSAEDAYRLLNVRADTQLEIIKAILTAYRRIWHPDRARDETEHILFTLKTQKLNVAWDLIQQERREIGSDAASPKPNDFG